MIQSGVIEPEDREGIVDPPTALLRDGAQKRIPQAVGAELEALRAPHGGRRTAAGVSGIVRNGFLPERELQIGVGTGDGSNSEGPFEGLAYFRLPGLDPLC